MNEILHKYQKIYGDLKKEVLPMRVKEHPKFYYSTLLNEKEHKYFQHIIEVCQWLIVAGRFELEYDVSSFIRLLSVPWVGHIELAGCSSSR